MYYDIHCHLDALDDPDAAVARARAAGLGLILTNGTDPASNRRAVALAQQHDIVSAALGVYPSDAVAMSEQAFRDELAFIRKSRPTAIGEVGLDYYHDTRSQREMRSRFEQLIALAEELRVPLLVHSRKAEQDVVEMLASVSVPVDLHCFGGSLKLARRAAAYGAFFSIPTSVVRSTHFRRLAEEVPLSQLLTETDAPWMSPDERQNEPANIPVVVREIATLTHQDLHACAEVLWENCARFVSSRARRHPA